MIVWLLTIYFLGASGVERKTLRYFDRQACVEDRAMFKEREDMWTGICRPVKLIKKSEQPA